MAGIGTIAVGKAADPVLIDYEGPLTLSRPETSVLDAVSQRARSEVVELVIVLGEIIYEGGRVTRIDRDAALRELHASLQ